MKPIILFDIDSTLLNSAKIHASTARHFWGKFKKFSWKTTLPDRQGLGYILFGRPKEFLDLPTVKDSFLAPKYYERALFEDVLPALKELKGKASLGIFTQGPPLLQRAKLRLSGIEKYFERELIFIFPPRKVLKARQVLGKLPRMKIYFVDDRADIAETLANHRVKVFLIRRNAFPVSGNGKVTVVHSLKEILNLI